MENSIELIYVDDNPDTSLSRFLDKFQKNLEVEDKIKSDQDKINFSWKDVPWEEEYSYQDLFKMDIVHDAEIVLIDSGLSNLSLSGEQIKILFKQFFPFKKVFVLSQQAELITNNFIEKYKTRGKSQDEINKERIPWYDERLKPRLLESIKQIHDERRIYSSLQKNQFIDGYQFEKVKDSIQGDSNVELLEKNDIDKLIEIVKELVDE